MKDGIAKLVFESAGEGQILFLQLPGSQFSEAGNKGVVLSAGNNEIAGSDADRIKDCFEQISVNLRGPDRRVHGQIVLDGRKRLIEGDLHRIGRRVY